MQRASSVIMRAGVFSRVGQSEYRIVGATFLLWHWRRFAKATQCEVLIRLINDVSPSGGRYMAGAAILGLSLVLIFSPIVECSLNSLSNYGVSDLAHILDALGRYELGERIFNTVSNGYVSLATSCGRNGHDTDRKEIANERLNRTVARVYGPSSRRMVWRYCCACNHFDDGDDKWLLVKSYAAGQKADRLFTAFGLERDAATNLWAPLLCRL
jgi:hypothetical protein